MTLARRQSEITFPGPPRGIPPEWQDLLDRIDQLELARARPPARRA